MPQIFHQHYQSTLMTTEKWMKLVFSRIKSIKSTDIGIFTICIKFASHINRTNKEHIQKFIDVRTIAHKTYPNSKQHNAKSYTHHEFLGQTTPPGSTVSFPRHHHHHHHRTHQQQCRLQSARPADRDSSASKKLQQWAIVLYIWMLDFFSADRKIHLRWFFAIGSVLESR